MTFVPKITQEKLKADGVNDTEKAKKCILITRKIILDIDVKLLIINLTVCQMCVIFNLLGLACLGQPLTPSGPKKIKAAFSYHKTGIKCKDKVLNERMY